jgi:hypothetical protein
MEGLGLQVAEDVRARTTHFWPLQRRVRQRSAATAIHGVPAAPSHTNTSTGLPMLSKLNRHLDNMAAAVTNEKAVLEALVSTNAGLINLSAEKLLKIEQLLVGIKSAGPRAPHSTATVATTPTNTRTVSQLRAAIKHKWVPGAFCSTHGWGAGPDHSSATCKAKKPGHVTSSTRANPQGPGTTRNKGWDDFLSS